MNTRRTFLHALLAGAAGLGIPVARSADRPAGGDLTFGFSLYGMKSVEPEEAIRKLAEIGFDSVELCLLPGWNTNPAKLTAEQRGRLRQVLRVREIRLTALMENLSLAGDAAAQEKARERLRLAGELAHQLVPDRPPLVETVMGNGRWEDVRNQFRDNLGGWAGVAEKANVVLAIKPHRFGAVNRPEDALWLLEQVKSKALRLVYDYSHFIHRDFSLAGTVKQLAPHTAFVHVKDTVIRDGKAVFLLPGECVTWTTRNS